MPLIEDLSLDVAPGQTIAIVGPTGAGKTTLVNLLMRFYDVDGGAIRVDGVDIRQIKRGALRRMFGMVLQDTWLFSGTIRENIAYGREQRERRGDRRGGEGRAGGSLHPHAAGELRHADQRGGEQPVARAEAAADDCAGVPGRPRDPDSRRGHEQRGHAHRGADSGVDGRLMRGRTTFVIAHRLSTIRNADLILMMEGGRIVERGSHHELLAAKGRYAALYESQFAGRGQMANA